MNLNFFNQPHYQIHLKQIKKNQKFWIKTTETPTRQKGRRNPPHYLGWFEIIHIEKVGTAYEVASGENVYNI